MSVKVGDKVRFLNDVGGGKVTKVIDKLSVMVMNESGFEVPSRINELVLIEEAVNYVDEEKVSTPKNNVQNTAPAAEQIIDLQDIFYPEVVIEPASGDDINLFMAFVPENRPGNSDLSVFIINDSNYNVLYSIINSDEQGKTLSNSVGVLEANTKEQFENMALASVNKIPEYIFHFVFYKKGEFTLKEPVSKSVKINPVRFYKEKAYTENDFFDNNVLMVSIFTERVLLNELNKLSETDIKKALTEKEKSEKKHEFSSPKENEKVLLEVDLHIHELIDDFRGYSNSEILEVQMTHFRSQLAEAQKKRIKKVVFIHGVGNGTLKLEIRRELEKMMKTLTFQDASFKEYGYGATMVQLK